MTSGVAVAANPEPALASAPGFPSLHSWQHFVFLIPVLTAAQARPRCPGPAQALPLGHYKGCRGVNPEEEGRRAAVPEVDALGLLGSLGAGSMLV